MSKAVRVMIVDDHALVAEGIEAILETYDDIDVVATVSDGQTAIAEAKDPIRMACAMKLAVEGGREAYLAGRMGRRKYADPSSPLAGLI